MAGPQASPYCPLRDLSYRVQNLPIIMQLVTLPSTGLRLSRFIFGTAQLFNAGGRTQRRRLLEAAIEQGFTHFDTAPYYGFGSAERDLHGVLKAHPQITVSSKVGLYSPGGERQGRVTILLRKAGGRLLRPLSRPTTDWSLVRARRSLDDSLQRLGRDCLDLFLLHAPERALLDTTAWRDLLEQEVRRGRIRHYGIAATTPHVEPFLQAACPLSVVVQTADSLATREADAVTAHGRTLQITYGYLSSSRQPGAPLDARSILQRALRRNPHGAIVVSTRRPERLPLYGSVLDGAP